MPTESVGAGAGRGGLAPDAGVHRRVAGRARAATCILDRRFVRRFAHMDDRSRRRVPPRSRVVGCRCRPLPPLVHSAEKVRSCLTQFRAPFDARPFLPHVTLARSYRAAVPEQSRLDVPVPCRFGRPRLAQSLSGGKAGRYRAVERLDSRGLGPSFALRHYDAAPTDRATPCATPCFKGTRRAFSHLDIKRLRKIFCAASRNVRTHCSACKARSRQDCDPGHRAHDEAARRTRCALRSGEPQGAVAVDQPASLDRASHPQRHGPWPLRRPR